MNMYTENIPPRPPKQHLNLVSIVHLRRMRLAMEGYGTRFGDVFIQKSQLFSSKRRSFFIFLEAFGSFPWITVPDMFVCTCSFLVRISILNKKGKYNCWASKYSLKVSRYPNKKWRLNLRIQCCHSASGMVPQTNTSLFPLKYLRKQKSKTLWKHQLDDTQYIYIYIVYIYIHVLYLLSLMT